MMWSVPGRNVAQSSARRSLATRACSIPSGYLHPHANIIYAVLGLVIFGGFTLIDFNRLRRAGNQLAVPIAASIFLDVFNVFLFFLQLFGGGRHR